MRDFEFLEARSAPEASRMLADCGEDGRLIAGGTALLLGMRQRLLTPTHLISLGRIPTLRRIEFDERNGLRIGALASHAEIADSPVVQARYPLLASMASRVANPQVRNTGTLGGNLCYGDPSTDPPACLLALGAQVVLASSESQRVLDIESFFVDYFQTALEPHEVMTEIRFPPLAFDTLGIYSRFLRTAAEHRPLANVAVVARRAGTVCREARIALGASTAIPARVRAAEEYLQGKIVTADVVENAARVVTRSIDTIADSRGTAEYRREVIGVVVQRAIASLFGLDETGTS